MKCMKCNDGDIRMFGMETVSYGVRYNTYDREIETVYENRTLVDGMEDVIYQCDECNTVYYTDEVNGMDVLLPVDKLVETKK